ncbi:sensor histidine kinase [Amycolatopsis sp. K13G38]|uniref:histidine kinase n=1 Tax=Amycolatopsis acididurans TaxID=2724524 RepID=A0ABX1J190_9PSEU|nr:ATP-binding protein [Amycolatopsis acididurans]NKQ53528.1 sensor histidine kinase [Amycolatopsis acididurans]
MSESPVTGVPAGEPDAVRQARSHLLRIVAVVVAIVAALGAAGVVLSLVGPASWTMFVSLGVAVACVAVVVIAAIRADDAVRGFAFAPPPQPFSPIPAPDPVARDAVFGDDAGQRREVFGKLARRLQSLVNRAIQRVDALERDIEDPDLLRGLYEVDHLATRVRRQAENLAVLGGGTPQRRSNAPVPVYAVLRSAVAEIEHYKQISIVPIEDVSLHGHVVAEVIHLLAELLENATTFTAPDAPKVVLRAQKVTAGLAIEVQDRGLGMTPDDLEGINRLLAGAAEIDLGELFQDGRIGIAVVKELAQRHGIRVRLQTNIFGGIDAAVVLPHNLIGDTNAVVERPTPAPRPAPPAEPVRLEAPTSQLPQLPTREPGHAYTPAPVAVDDSTDWGAVDETARPPLPQRRGSHLRPELLEPPAATRPLPGHNTNLMATVQKGLDRGREEERNEPGTAQGESPLWPKI